MVCYPLFQQSNPNQTAIGGEVKHVFIFLFCFPHLRKINEKYVAVVNNLINSEKRRLSYPSILDDLFNDISIRENLKRKY